MAFQFPASPVVGQTYTPSAGITFKWNGTAWYLVNSTLLTPTEADTRYVQIANARSMESRIINGNFAIDQRQAGAAILATHGVATYPLDRWKLEVSGAGTVRGRRAVDAGRPGLFFLGATVVATDATPAGYYDIGQVIEGSQLVGLQFGGLLAQPFTLAFDVTSTVAGTFPVSFRNDTVTRTFIKTFTVAAGVATSIVMTIPGDTAGTWNYGTGAGMIFHISLGAIASLNAPTANAWVAGNFLSIAGCTNMMATANAEMYISNVRLYPGSIDYGPCQRLYADELRLCQRYYCKTFRPDIVPVQGFANPEDALWGKGTTTGVAEPWAMWHFPVTMRDTPTVTLYGFTGGAAGQWSAGGADNSANARVWAPGPTHVLIDNSDVGLAAIKKYLIAATASAEL